MDVNERKLFKYYDDYTTDSTPHQYDPADISALKFLQESFYILNKKYETIFNQLKYIHEENATLKTEVGKLKKELESDTSARGFSKLNIDLVSDDKRLDDFPVKLSAENASKFYIPFSKQACSSDQEQHKEVKNVLALLKWRHVLYGLVIIIILIAVSTTLVLLSTTSENNVSDEEELSSNYSARLVTRKYWLALPERPGVLKYKRQPVDIVMVGHTAGSACTLTEACQALVRTFQADAFSRGWSDISYNFFLGGDGLIYEGRGWDKQASHTLNYNNISIGVAFIGSFVRDPPPKKQLTAFQILLDEGVGLGKLVPDYKILLQKQVRPTESPGAALINILKKWHHWSDAE